MTVAVTETRKEHEARINREQRLKNINDHRDSAKSDLGIIATECLILRTNMQIAEMPSDLFELIKSRLVNIEQELKDLVSLVPGHLDELPNNP